MGIIVRASPMNLFNMSHVWLDLKILVIHYHLCINRMLPAGTLLPASLIVAMCAHGTTFMDKARLNRMVIVPDNITQLSVVFQNGECSDRWLITTSNCSMPYAMLEDAVKCLPWVLVNNTLNGQRGLGNVVQYMHFLTCL